MWPVASERPESPAKRHAANTGHWVGTPTGLSDDWMPDVLRQCLWPDCRETTLANYCEGHRVPAKVLAKQNGRCADCGLAIDAGRLFGGRVVCQQCRLRLRQESTDVETIVRQMLALGPTKRSWVISEVRRRLGDGHLPEIDRVKEKIVAQRGKLWSLKEGTG